MDIYKSLLRPVLLWLDPEDCRSKLIGSVAWLNKQEPDSIGDRMRQLAKKTFVIESPSLAQQLWGLTFSNPLGVAAGVDKDGEAPAIWPDFGFGFAELGTVTYHAQDGNPKPRLFRLPSDEAIINRMGFNNKGASAMAEALKNSAIIHSKISPIGINLGKSKITPLSEAATDYLESFKLLKNFGDYFVVNISSPNTPGLRSLQARDQLIPILDILQQENQAKKPLLVKIAPDLTWEEINDIIKLAQQFQLAGIIATNTTISRAGLKTKTVHRTGKPPEEIDGGLSGVPVRQRSTEVIRFIYEQTQGKLPIIGVGGVFTADDAWEKITAGASLVQVYTGWIYEGPWMVRRILTGLTEQLQQSGFSQLSEAVGSDNPIPSQRN